MKIILHPGLHKTGTTSIQMFLRAAFGSEEPTRIWYPMRPILSPGHASLPFNLRRDHLREKGFELLRDYIDRAVTNGTEVLIISAEDIGWLDQTILIKMREFMVGHFLQLVFTLTPYKARAVSQWQENVKHGEKIPIKDKETLFHPKLEPQLVSRVVDAFAPDECVAIVSSKSLPSDWLIRTFLEAVDLHRHIEGAIDKNGKEVNYSLNVNRSFGAVEIEIIRHLNICFEYLKNEGISFDEGYIRRRITNCLTSADWKTRVPKIKIESPAEWEMQIREQALLAQRDIEMLQESGRIKVFGDVKSLVDGITETSTNY